MSLKLGWHQIFGESCVPCKGGELYLVVKGVIEVWADFYIITYKRDCDKVAQNTEKHSLKGREYLGRCEEAPWVSAGWTDCIGLWWIDVENEGREGDSRRLKGNSLSKSLETEDLQGLFGVPWISLWLELQSVCNVREKIQKAWTEGLECLAETFGLYPYLGAAIMRQLPLTAFVWVT